MNFLCVSGALVSNHPSVQRKHFSFSPGLVDFAIGLVNSVFHLSDGQVIFF